MTVTSQPVELTWGALVLDAPVAPDVSWVCETLADGSSFGNPQALIEEIRSQLDDGSLSVVTGYGNREASFRLRLSAPDGPSLAAAEAAFFAEVQAEQPAPLVYVPAALDAEETVLEVVHATFERDYSDDWDFEETTRLYRYFTLTLTCLPSVRALNLTEIPAIPAPVAPGSPASYTMIDDCASTSGWSLLPMPGGPVWSGTSLAVSSGTLRAQGTVRAGSDGATSLSQVRTGAVSMTGTPYLTVDISSSLNLGGAAPTATDFFVVFDSVSPLSGPGSIGRAPVAATATSTPGMTRYFFEAPASFGAVRIARTCAQRATTSTLYTFWVHEVGKVDRIEVDGSNGFQIARTAMVGGTVPTQAALTFDAGEDPLIGSTALIYTGASPVVPMRALRTSSATVTTDATMISGGRNTLASAMTFRVPVDRFTSGATYDLLARCSFTGSATVTWSAKVVDSTGATMPGSEVVASGTVLLTNSTTDPWKIHQIGAAQLPPVVIEGTTTHLVEVSLSMASGGSGVQVDEAWLLDSDNGAVTVIHEPSASQLSRVEIRSPRLDAPRHQVVGTWLTHGTQDITRLVTAPGRHRFPPGLLHVFTATDMAKYAECSLRYYERHGWHVFTATSETA